MLAGDPACLDNEFTYQLALQMPSVGTLLTLGAHPITGPDEGTTYEGRIVCSTPRRRRLGSWARGTATGGLRVVCDTGGVVFCGPLNRKHLNSRRFGRNRWIGISSGLGSVGGSGVRRPDHR
jgi:hypothetical protein